MEISYIGDWEVLSFARPGEDTLPFRVLIGNGGFYRCYCRGQIEGEISVVAGGDVCVMGNDHFIRYDIDEIILCLILSADKYDGYAANLSAVITNTENLPVKIIHTQNNDDYRSSLCLWNMGRQRGYVYVKRTKKIYVSSSICEVRDMLEKHDINELNNTTIIMDHVSYALIRENVEECDYEATIADLAECNYIESLESDRKRKDNQKVLADWYRSIADVMRTYSNASPILR